MSAYMPGERLVRVEEQVLEMRSKMEGMENKLDELMSLRYKGAGAFWLAATLVGTGIVAAFTQLLHYIGVR